MAGPSDDGGIGIDIPGGADAVRDMHALIRAILRGDDEGQAAILAGASLPGLARLLAATIAALLTAIICSEADPDAPPSALTGEQLLAAESILLAGVTGPDDDPGGLGP
jgi:hypothetical protein